MDWNGCGENVDVLPTSLRALRQASFWEDFLSGATHVACKSPHTIHEVERWFFCYMAGGIGAASWSITRLIFACRSCYQDLVL